MNCHWFFLKHDDSRYDIYFALSDHSLTMFGKFLQIKPKFEQIRESIINLKEIKAGYWE